MFEKINNNKNKQALVIEGETILLSLPIQLNDNDVHYFQTEFNSSPYFLLNYSGLSCNITKAGIVGKRWFPDPYSIPKYSGKKTHFYKRYFYNILTKHPQKVDYPVTVIHNPWCPGYFHWLTEALVRLLLYEKHGDSGAKLALPAYFKDIPYIMDSIRCLTDREILYIKEGACLKVRNLSYISNTQYTAQYHPAIMHELSAKIKRHFKITDQHPAKRVYVSRTSAKSRFVVNEAELIAILRQHDFDIVMFESLSFYEQVKLMSETKVLISIHGAGLTNMMFMPPGGSVMELQLSPAVSGQYSQIYYYLASVSNLHYHYAFCQPANEADYSIYRANIKVDLAQFASNLEQLLGNSCVTE